MDTPRTAIRPTATTLLVALSAGLLASPPANADSVIAADATAQNVSAFGTTRAWSRRAADGTYRLVVMGASRVPADAPVRRSSIPFDPDVGPTMRGTQYIVFIRCSSPVTGRGCDIYGYDVSRRTARKLTAVSDPSRSEGAPSYFKGAIAFVRNGSRHGLYVAAAGHRPRRVATSSSHETDLSATHVISNSEYITVRRRDGSHAREFDQNHGGEEAFSAAYSPVLSRDRAFWIDGGGEYRMHDQGEPWMVRVGTVSVHSDSSRAEYGDHKFPAKDMATIALGPSGMPELYSGAGGVARINPLLTFAS
ncbi:MAG: hypothetical protein H0W96_11265 [Solirubrobacterales bacterium]|nr:hypothetical protein [Solirubrobacterales bacterium]